MFYNLLADMGLFTLFALSGSKLAASACRRCPVIISPDSIRN